MRAPRSVTIVPLFLGAGGHVRKDVPVLLDGLRQAHPQVSWQLAPAIGEIPEVVAAMARASLQLAGVGPGIPRDTPRDEGRA